MSCVCQQYNIQRYKIWALCHTNHITLTNKLSVDDSCVQICWWNTQTGFCQMEVMLKGTHSKGQFIECITKRCLKISHTAWWLSVCPYEEHFSVKASNIQWCHWMRVNLQYPPNINFSITSWHVYKSVYECFTAWIVSILQRNYIIALYMSHNFDEIHRRIVHKVFGFDIT